MSSELKLSLENFQSISNGELVFHKGLNFIIGQSNSGKSATFRALKTCLSNPMGSQKFIKKGTRKASVLLEYNGNQIIWNRTSGESSYTINGEQYVKTGKSSALKILGSETGFVTDDNEVIMNIEEELQLPFPFGLSASDLFKLYENVFCISDSAVILKAAKEREEGEKDKVASLELDLQKNQHKLQAIEDFEASFNPSVLEKYKEELITKRDRISFLKEGMDIIRKAQKVEEAILQVPDVAFSNHLIELKDKVSLKKLVVKLKRVQKLSKEMSTLNTSFDNKLDKYNELLSLKREAEVISNLNNLKLKELDFENKLVKLKELQQSKETFVQLKRDLASRTEALKKTNETIKELEEKLSGFDVCPLCHAQLNKGEN